MNIDIVVFNGVDELDAIAPFEVFSNAARAASDLHTRLVTLDVASEVVGASGLSFRASDLVTCGGVTTGLDLASWNRAEGHRRPEAMRA